MTSQQQNHTNNTHEIEPIYLHQWIDCCDFHSKWYEAQIIEISKASNRHIKVHYKGWSAKFDSWIDLNNKSDSDRVCILHTHTVQPPILGILNRYEIGTKCDCLDSNDKWYQASIVNISTNKKLLKIHYNNWASKYDEWINKDSYRISPLHTMTTPLPTTPIEAPPPPPPIPNITQQTTEIKDNSDENTTKQRHKQIQEKYLQNFKPTLKDEQQFRIKLKHKGLIIEDMDEDGNCLFRSISHQIYGTQQFHMLLRQKCVEYIEGEYEYFSAYVPNGNDKEQFKQYCMCMRLDGKWGDNIEIQAFSEIYGRPIEIYAYDNKPMKTFTNNGKHTTKILRNVPIRLSYHGNSHYNSIINPNEFGNNIISANKVGQLEDEKIKLSSLRTVEASIQTKKASDTEFTDKQLLESVLNESRKQFERNDIFDPIQILTDKGYSLEMATMAYSAFASEQNKIESETFIQKMIDYIEQVKKASSFGYQDVYLLE